MSQYVGQRCSYQGERCTVRYIGSVANKQGTWLGVEWDDAGKGKHDGSYEGVKYFSCQHASATAGSFIRPNRPKDAALGFIEAMQNKYVSTSQKTSAENEVIRISGKTVEEVGFEKIERKLAGLTDLKIVVLEMLGINGINNVPFSMTSQTSLTPTVSQLLAWLQSTKIEDLDLSRNLLETWTDVYLLIVSIPRLQILKLAGNRFQDLKVPDSRSIASINHHLTELNLGDTLLDFSSITRLTRSFPNLSTLTASHNQVSTIPDPFSISKLQHLDVSFNAFMTLDDLSILTTLPSLTTLSLRGNPLPTLTTTSPLTFPTLTHLDISHTQLPSLESLDPISTVFPSLTHLQTHHTPLSSLPSSSLLTIARLGTLTELNYSPITAAERQNTELYYISRIMKQLSDANSAEEQQQILSEHPRWRELCEKYGEPDIQRKDERERVKEEYPPGTLGSRIVKFVFALGDGDGGISTGEVENVSKTKLVPVTISTYHLLGIVAGMFELPYVGLRLVMETEEFDVVGDAQEDEFSDIGDLSDDDLGKGKGKEEKDKWVRREEELVGSNKPIADWLPVGFVGGPSKELKIRVESNHDWSLSISL